MNKLATVMMLSYNNIQYMKGAIDSLLNQSYEQIELIISDDGSNDFDEIFIESIREYIESNKKDNLVNYIIRKNEINIGTVKNINKIILLSSGNYLIPLSCDDEFYDKDVVRDIVEYFDTHEQIIATGYRVYFDENLEIVNDIYPKQKDIEYLYRTPQELYKRLCSGNFISGSSTPYTRAFIEKYGLFDEDYRLLEDFPKYLNITRRGCSIGFINRKLVKYRYGGVSTNNTKNIIKEQFYNDHITLNKKEIFPYN
ncbi:glycosyltransferase [Tepidibacter hydrothermalis]|uniref:Glycosyltransferase n=1 Tax=Tepidibacter hydrothermalis TaxID=3036126 RepID=A0ABY8EEL7_9FIRM|nr:glycosyltransferase [Tepidibacter hydrothermalis]WFD11388.1 glycosyltransferase [Tepidibacter hydrothermalis]